MTAVITTVGKSVGTVVGVLYQAGRDSIDQVIRNVLPFMAFIAFLIGLILETGVGEALAEGLTGLSDSVFGLLILSIVIAIPILSPLLGPGAVIAQIIGTLIGVQIGEGNIDPSLSLVALWAINPQVGCDFVPVGLALGEAEPETVEIGVPAVLFSRLITGPLAVLIAWAFSFGLYT